MAIVEGPFQRIVRIDRWEEGCEELHPPRDDNQLSVRLHYSRVNYEYDRTITWWTCSESHPPYPQPLYRLTLDLMIEDTRIGRLPILTNVTSESPWGSGGNWTFLVTPEENGSALVRVWTGRYEEGPCSSGAGTYRYVDGLGALVFSRSVCMIGRVFMVGTGVYQVVEAVPDTVNPRNSYWRARWIGTQNAP